MKTFIYTILIILSFSLIPTEGNAQSIFIGTWEYQNGNEVFKVNLFEDNDSIKGHYKMIQINNGIETIIYSSNKDEFQNSNNVAWLPFVIAGSGSSQIFSGIIYDNTINANEYHFLKKGDITIEILSNSGGLNPTITASWKIKKHSGIIINESPDFSVPTDIILTKVN